MAPVNSPVECRYNSRGWSVDGTACADINAAFSQLQRAPSLRLVLRAPMRSGDLSAAFQRLQDLVDPGVCFCLGAGSPGFAEFPAALPQLPHLAKLCVELHFCGDCFAGPAYKALAAALPQLQGLVGLTLGLCGSTDADFAVLAPALVQMPHLAELRFLLDGSAVAGWARLAAALPGLAGLAELELRLVGIDDAGCEHLAVALGKLKQLTKLEILNACCNSSEEGQNRLRTAAQQLPRLTEFSWDGELEDLAQASPVARLRRLLADGAAWREALAGEAADEEVAGSLLRCLGCGQENVRPQSPHAELDRQLADAKAPDDATLRQALDMRVLDKLMGLLPPTEVREVRAKRYLDQCRADPASELPALWRRLHAELGSTPVPCPARQQRTLLVLAPGFALRSRPEQAAQLTEGGWRVHTCHAKDPGDRGFNMDVAFAHVLDDVKMHKPDAILAASRGGGYLLKLWEHGCTVPSVMVNIHPDCAQLPKDVCIVLCHGLRDRTFERSREELEQLMQSGDAQRHFLYVTEDSGANRAGGRLRQGDKHEMASLLEHDTLNRLVDAAIAAAAEDPCPPDQYLIETWRGFLSAERRQAEKFLGHSPGDLLKLWESQPDDSDGPLREVRVDSEEFKAVRDIFLARREQSCHYQSRDVPGRLLRVQRVQNGMHQEGLQARHDAFRHSITNQGLQYKADVHTRWLFHGPRSEKALESIVEDMDGFNPGLSGSGVGSLWGYGVYFARDAQYVAEGYAAKLPSGEMKILLCLVETGMPCLASPHHTGQGVLLPHRKQKHRFHSTVDSLSNPEIWVVQKSSQALPAYVITFD